MPGPLSELMFRIVEINQANGWFDRDRLFDTDTCLLNEEVAEAYREYRDGHEPGEQRYVCQFCHQMYFDYPLHGICTHVDCPSPSASVVKPEGVPAELIDIIIRALDSLYRAGINPDEAMAEKMAYNKTREYRHGGKRT